MKKIKNIARSKKTIGMTSQKKKRQIDRGTILECYECGMVVRVDELCGCEEYHPIVCCDEPMKVR